MCCSEIPQEQGASLMGLRIAGKSTQKWGQEFPAWKCSAWVEVWPGAWRMQFPVGNSTATARPSRLWANSPSLATVALTAIDDAETSRPLRSDDVDPTALPAGQIVAQLNRLSLPSSTGRALRPAVSHHTCDALDHIFLVDTKNRAKIQCHNRLCVIARSWSGAVGLRASPCL